MSGTWTAGISVVLALASVSARAQVPDHLACYKVKDTFRLKGVVNLETPEFGVAPGCRVSAAKLFCVAATKRVVTVANGSTPITPLPFTGTPEPDDRICYKMKCPDAAIAGQTVTDQFGTRTLSRFTASMLCTPAVRGAAVCGDGHAAPPEQCDGSDLSGATCASLGEGDGVLACTPGCRFDTTGCTGSSLGGAFLETGQTSCWDVDGNVVPCAGSGQDGEVRAGAALSYTDNGDGTVTDDNTGLVWEKLSDDGGVHDKDNLLTWGNAFVHIATLNAAHFAGHTDWRLPNVNELRSIVNYGAQSPAVSSVFDIGCTPQCTVLDCSCTTASFYWASTTDQSLPTYAWGVNFFQGAVFSNIKLSDGFVRAVRGGSSLSPTSTSSTSTSTSSTPTSTSPTTTIPPFCASFYQPCGFTCGGRGRCLDGAGGLVCVDPMSCTPGPVPGCAAGATCPPGHVCAGQIPFGDSFQCCAPC
jgi:hypothetical protein